MGRGVRLPRTIEQTRSPQGFLSNENKTALDATGCWVIGPIQQRGETEKDESLIISIGLNRRRMVVFPR